MMLRLIATILLANVIFANCDLTVPLSHSDWFGSGQFETKAPGFVGTANVQLVGVRLYSRSQSWPQMAAELDYSNGVTVSLGDHSSMVLEDWLVLKDEEGERIVQVSGVPMASLTLTTNIGRTISINGDVAPIFEEDAPSGHELIGMDSFTSSGDPEYVLTSIRCVWREMQTDSQSVRFTQPHLPFFGDSFVAPKFLFDQRVRLTVITLWGGPSGMTGLEFEYSNGVQFKQGSLVGDRKELALQHGEYISRTGGNDNFNIWWFKTNQNRRISMGSGSSPNEDTPFHTFLPAKDCHLNDMVQLRATTWPECSSKCADYSGCTHWTWDSSPNLPHVPSCWLKDGTCDPSPTNRRISGIIPDSSWELVGFSGLTSTKLNSASFAWRRYQPNTHYVLQTDESFGYPDEGEYFTSDVVALSSSQSAVKTLNIWGALFTTHAFQFVYSDSEDPPETNTFGTEFGTSQLYPQDINFEQGEYITSMEVVAGVGKYQVFVEHNVAVICQLYVTTNHGRTMGVGQCRGQKHTFYPPATEPGLDWELVGMRGYHFGSNVFVRRIAPIWRAIGSNGLKAVVYKNMELDWSKSKTLAKYDTVLMEVSTENDSDTEQTSSVQRKYSSIKSLSFTDSFTASYSYGISLGYSISFETGAKVAGTGTTKTHTFSVDTHFERSTEKSTSQSKTTTTREDLALTFNLVAKPHTTAIGTAVGFWERTEVPYTAELHITLADNTVSVSTVEGVVTGSSLRSDITYSSEPRPLA